MSIPFVCDKCGTSFQLGGMQITGNAYFSGNIVDCPVPECDGEAYHEAGYYQFVEGVITAFTAEGMTREKVEAARSIAKEASEGGITTEDALQRLEAISETLAKAVTQSQGRKVNWEFLLTLFALIWTIWSDRQSDAGAQAALAEARTQTEVAQKMLEESQAQTESLRELATRPTSQPQAPAQTNGSKNRAERRKAAAVERRQRSRARPKTD